MNAPKNGAELVVRTLEARGVEYVFGVPGAKIDTVFDALVDSTIKTVVCRHEQNAAFIAGGIGRMTGRAGVAIATSGPGVSNLTTGLATANSEGDPVVALGGAVPLAEGLKQIHQSMDAVAIMKPVTKFSATAGAPHAVTEVLNNAFRAAESGRPGAAYVNLPMDVMMAPAGARLLDLPFASGPGPADPGAIAEAARLLTAAENPVVLLGLLASKPANAEAVRAFLERNKLAVVGTFQSAGAVANTCWRVLAAASARSRTSRPTVCWPPPTSSSPSAMIRSSSGHRSGTRAMTAASSTSTCSNPISMSITAPMSS